MDNRKNIKIIDEHGIDRLANIMCSIDVDGTDYVVYSIKRDDENDNLFISKLIRNNDGTSNMINIDDTTEKSMLADVVKELVTYAINNDADKTTGEVVLSNGRKVTISSVLFNKEQNINVGKTYITTVKRAVTKVSETFYYIEYSEPKPVVESVFDNSVMNDSVFPETPSEPEQVLAAEPVMDPVNVEPILPEVPAVPPVIEPEVSPEPALVSEPVELVTEPSVSVVPPVVDPILPTDPVLSEPVSNAAATFVTPSANPQPDEFFTPTAPSVEVPPVAPTDVAPVEPVNNQLVFDGSKETNLNVALGEVSKDNILPVADVAPIREFGQDEVLTPAAPAVDTLSSDTTPDTTTTSTSGFANNKFFMVIAVAFFLAACVFLGYEVFRYFKIVG